MDKIVLVLILIIVFSSTTSAEWIDRDKTLHFAAGMSIYSVTDYLSCDDPMRWVLIAAASKEIYDHFNDGHVRFDDITATTLGGISAAYFLNVEYEF